MAYTAFNIYLQTISTNFYMGFQKKNFFSIIIKNSLLQKKNPSFKKKTGFPYLELFSDLQQMNAFSAPVYTEKLACLPACLSVNPIPLDLMNYKSDRDKRYIIGLSLQTLRVC